MCNFLCPYCRCCPALTSGSTCCKCCSGSNCCEVKVEKNDFYNSQWQRIPVVRKWFLIYKSIHLALLLIILCTNIGLWKGHFLWLIYYSHWALLACVLQAWFGLIITVCAYLRQDKTKTAEANRVGMPCVCSEFYCEVYLIALNQTLLVSILYRATGYGYDEKVSGIPWFASCLVHVLSALVMVTDLCVVRVPVKMWSAIWSLIFFLSYAIFLFLFHFFGGDKKYEFVDVPYSYKIFDWKDRPTMAGIMILIGLVANFLVYLFTFALFLFRRCIYLGCFYVMALNQIEKDEPIPSPTQPANVAVEEKSTRIPNEIKESET